MSLRSRCRHRINIEANYGAEDGAGNVPDNFRPKYVNVRCLVEALTAQQRAGQWLGQPTLATHRIRIPDGTLEIDETMRVVWGARILKIQGATPARGKRGPITLNCEEVK